LVIKKSKEKNLVINNPRCALKSLLKKKPETKNQNKEPHNNYEEKNMCILQEKKTTKNFLLTNR